MRPANCIVRAAQFAAAALFLAASVSQAQTNDRAAVQITQLYHLSDMAADAQDCATSASLIEPTFVLIGPKGDLHDRTQVLASLKEEYERMHALGFHTQTTTQIKAIRVRGDHADVLSSQHQILRHAARTLVLDTTGKEQWVHTPAGWKLAQSRILTARQDKPTASVLSPQEQAALNTLIAVRNRAALQNLDDSVTLFNQTLDIDRSQNAASQQIREEEQRRRHREAYGY